jgi:3-hydroxyisobutyrate dehydrogenase
MVMKLVVNALFGIQVAAVAELLGLIRSTGVSEARAVEVLSELPVTSPAARMAVAQALSKNFAPPFPIDLVEKDFRYAIQSARATKADLPTVQSVKATFARAKLEGHGADHISGVAKLF